MELPPRIPVLDGDVLPFYVAKLTKGQANCLDTGGVARCVGRSIDPLSAGLSSAAAPWQTSKAQRAWRKA